MQQIKDAPQGTLAPMVLENPDVLRPLHGYGIAERIEQISDELFSLNQGTRYPLLLRPFYRLTRAGHKLIETAKRDGEQAAAIIARFFAVQAQDLA